MTRPSAPNARPSVSFTRIGLLIGIPIAVVVGIQTIVWAAANLKTWSSGDTLTSVDLNKNFTAIDEALARLDGLTVTPAGDVGIGTTSPNATLDVVGFGRTVSSAFNARSVAEFGGGSASNNGILFNTGATPGTSSVRGLYMASASQLFSIARFDAAGTAPPTFDLTVADDGKVGIGTTTPSGSLTVSGTGGWSSSNYGTQLIVSTVPGASFPTIGILDSDNANPWAITNAIGSLRFSQMPPVGSNAANTERVTFLPDGRTVNTSGVWATFSDRRLKKDIRPIEGALETVTSLKGMSFRWKDDKKDQELGRVEGFIAQDVERVKPQWVKLGSDGYRQIQTVGMDALLVEAIKEQQRQIEGLREQNRRLQAQVDRIEVGRAQRSRAVESSVQAMRK